jgi:ribosomal protein L40E
MQKADSSTGSCSLIARPQASAGRIARRCRQAAEALGIEAPTCRQCGEPAGLFASICEHCGARNPIRFDIAPSVLVTGVLCELSLIFLRLL